MKKCLTIILFFAVQLNAQNTFSLNNYFKIDDNAFTISSSPNNLNLINDKSYSLMVGFNSNLPSLYVGPSNGLNTTGDVGIGTVYTNGFKLNVAGDVALKRLCIGGENIPEDCLLAIEGKLICEDIQVTETNKWPDYVFDENYELITIEEMGFFIKKEKHLPEIPSKQSVIKNGISQAELNTLLLKKIEELSLYIIELNDQIKTLKVNPIN